jgi:sulfur relay (sulfurtransferase) complex TusBCD TusD component (DsrE family)
VVEDDDEDDAKHAYLILACDGVRHPLAPHAPHELGVSLRVRGELTLVAVAVAVARCGTCCRTRSRRPLR